MSYIDILCHSLTRTIDTILKVLANISHYYIICVSKIKKRIELIVKLTTTRAKSEALGCA